MLNDASLIEPVEDVATEMVRFCEWSDDPRTDGYPTQNQILWKKRQDPEFRAAVMSRFGRDWFVHLPSLTAYMAGKRRPSSAA